MEGHPVAGHTVQTAEEWCVLRESDSFVVCLARVPYVYFTVSRMNFELIRISPRHNTTRPGKYFCRLMTRTRYTLHVH